MLTGRDEKLLKKSAKRKKKWYKSSDFMTISDQFLAKKISESVDCTL